MVAHLANGGAGGVLGQLANMNPLRQSGGGGIPFIIQGTTANPVFLPDVAGAIGQSVGGQQQSGQGLGSVLGGLFGKKKL